MRIVVITSSYPREPGDAGGHFVHAEVEALARAGHQLTLVAPGSRAVAVPGVDTRLFGADTAFGWPGIMARLRQRPLAAVSLLFGSARARALVQSAEPADRVIAHWIVPCAWPIALVADAPLEVVAHGSDVRLLLSLPGVVRRRVLSDLLERGARFRFVSHELRQALIAATSRELAAQSFVEPCAAPVGEVAERAIARAALGIAGDARLAVIVARLVSGKRVGVALRAAALIPGLQTVVVGDGPERARLQRDFGTVRFVGQLPRPDALLWMRAADFVLSASRREGAPTVLREARALGVPVVTTPCGDVARWAAADPELHVTER
jgi:glycosyltransferase involved in cell wall biosynthesis